MTEEKDYDLALSVKGLGKLNPVLKDAFGHVIDGFHRLELDPNWPCITVDFVDTPQKLEAARLATNTNRRKVSPEEISLRISLLAKSGLKAEEISGLTGLGVSTVFKYYPQEMKQPEKVSAGAIGGAVSALRVEQTVKTPDTPSASDPIPSPPISHLETAQKAMVECERCHVTTTAPTVWHNHNLCESCLPKAEANPVAFDGYFHYLSKKPESKAVLTTPKSIETWEQRKAQMSPQHSRMESLVLASLIEAGVTGLVQDRRFCVLETVPDIYIPQKNLAIYLDSTETHEGKRLDKDEQLRDFLVKRHGVRVLAYSYDSSSVKEVERVTKEILSVVKVEETEKT